LTSSATVGVSRSTVREPLSVYLLITRPNRSAARLFVRPHTWWVSIRRCDKQRRSHWLRTDLPVRLQSGNLVYPETAGLCNRFPAVHLASNAKCHGNKSISCHMTACITFTRYPTEAPFITSTDKYWIYHFAHTTGVLINP